MTAQEIGALAMMKNLTRIWVPEGTPKEHVMAGFDKTWAEDNYEKLIADLKLGPLGILYTQMGKDNAQIEKDIRQTYKYKESSYFRFFAVVDKNTHFQYYERYSRWVLFSVESPPVEEPPPTRFFAPMGCLSLDDEWEGIFRADLPGPHLDAPITAAKRKEFTTKWLPFFRRNCWLSGCDIECTTQERSEWIQDLTHEEIKTWKLKV